MSYESEELSEAPKRLTPISRTMAPLPPGRAVFPQEQEDEVMLDVIQHYGVQGMRWGVRNSPGGSAGRSMRRTLKKAGAGVTKAKRNITKKVKAKQESKANKAKTKAELKKRKKSPKDMDDDELKEYHTRVTAQRKLQAAAKNSSLDGVSRETAKKILRESEGMSTAELKKTGDKLAERGRQLNELRPSTNAKQGIGWKLAKTALKSSINTDAAIDMAMSKTMKPKSDSAKTTKAKPNFMVNNLKSIVKENKNAKIDAAVDRVWKYKIDKKGGF